MDSGTYDRRVERDNKVWQLIDEQGVLTSCKNDYLDLVIVKEAPSISRYYYAGKFEDGVGLVMPVVGQTYQLKTNNIPTVLFVNRTYVGLEIIILKHVDYLLR
jgi:hypothetical protein